MHAADGAEVEPKARHTVSDQGGFPGSIVVPVHNELARGLRVLPTLLAAIDAGYLVVAVCNGCTDGSAGRLRTVHGLRVLELAAPDKAAALNAGDAEAGAVFPRLYLDADVQTGIEDVEALMDELRSGTALGAGPLVSYDPDGAPWIVRSYFRALEQLPFLHAFRSQHLDGRGCYGVSKEGHERIGVFPPIRADDTFVDQVLREGERTTVPKARVVLAEPHSVAGFLRGRIRSAQGASELQDWRNRGTGPDRGRGRAPLAARLRAHLRQGLVRRREPEDLAIFVVYASVEALARGVAIALRVLGRRAAWR